MVTNDINISQKAIVVNMFFEFGRKRLSCGYTFIIEFFKNFQGYKENTHQLLHIFLKQ